MNALSPFLQRVMPKLNVAVFLIAATVGTFIGGLWGGLGIGGGLVFFISTWIIDKKIPAVSPALLKLTACLLAAIGLANTQAEFPGMSWHYFWQECTIVLPLIMFFSPQVLARVENPKLFSLLTYAALVAALALGVEMAMNGPLLHLIKGPNTDLTEYNRGISYLVVLALPLLAYLWINGRRREALLFALVILFPASLTESRATKMAFLFGLATTGIASFFPKLTRYALTALFIGLLSYPFAITYFFLHYQSIVLHLPPSWHHRVEIWDFMSYRIFEHPYLGWGMWSSHLLDFKQPHGAMYVFATQKVSHPHDVIIQLWVELGLPGLAVGTAFALYMIYKSSRLPAALVPFAYGAWMSALAISLVSYSFWDDSLSAMFAFTSLAFVLLAHQNPTSSQSSESLHANS